MKHQIVKQHSPMKTSVKKYNIHKIKNLLPSKFSKAVSSIFSGESIYECMDGRIIDMREENG